jgi:DNA repair exonuclease SbcCD ATPase subunit
VQRENERLRSRIAELEREVARLAEPVVQNPRQEELGKYTAKLRRQVRALEDEKAELERAAQDWHAKYDQAVQKVRDGPKAEESPASLEMPSASGDDGSGRPGDPVAELRAARLRVERLRTQNEEMQLRLGKANTTIERLNQLVQRKETLLTALQAELDRMKQRDTRPPSRKRG